MRKIEIVFSNDKRELFRDTPKDDSTCRYNGPIRFYDDILPFTIPAKNVYAIKLHGGLWNSDDKFLKIWETNHISLSYRDEKDKEIIVPIKKVEFYQYFKNYPV